MTQNCANGRVMGSFQTCSMYSNYDGIRTMYLKAWVIFYTAAMGAICFMNRAV